MRQLGKILMWTSAVWAAAVPVASAQSLGSFSWQLQPLCNTVVVTVTQTGGVYTLDGYDSQCGAATRASVVGLATPNPNGSIGLGFTVVSAPGGVPVHVSATITAPSYGGTWQDSAGRSGAFVLGGNGAGSPRPLSGGVGAAAVNPAEVQLRVAGACPAGQTATAVNQDGSLTCMLAAAGAGDITAVTAGPGLTGGATSGAATLAVAFGADGTATTVARSDHEHVVGATSIAVGLLALGNRTTGDANVALGEHAMRQTTTGAGNVAVGGQTLFQNIAGNDNTAVGDGAGYDTTGNENVFIGGRAGNTNGSGSQNLAVGFSARVAPGLTNAAAIGAYSMVTQSNSIVLGAVAGANTATNPTRVAIGLTTPQDMLHVVGDIRVSGCVKDAAGTPLGGVCSSDLRFKTDVAPFGPMLSKVAALRPVHYFWRNQEFPSRSFGDGPTYGLIAQDVEQVLPELVTTDADGYRAVNYSQLPLLAIQAISELKAWNDEAERRIAALEAARRGGRR